MSGEAKHCLVISDGRLGIENQALGLAEASAALRPMSIEPYHINHGKILAALPPKFQMWFAKLDLPQCDIAIGCGRQAIAPLIKLKRRLPEVMTVYVQDPRIHPSNFDLVIAPAHDLVSGLNVQSMVGSPNRVTSDKIEIEMSHFSDQISRLPAPRTVMLIGGTSKTRNLDQVSHAIHMDTAKSLLAIGHSLLISMSRRTPEFARQAWKNFGSGNESVWLYDGEGANPYFAFLGAADLILVTEDSTNMLTEACTTGTPVFRLPMSGRVGKFANLYATLEDRCHVVPFSGQLVGEAYPPLQETALMAHKLWNSYDSLMGP